ncbi:MAG TPA: serine/threonine-protein kinase [Actinomycetes bacterium]|nr:serine/threonine-protein kinase [Actinomycetes bacterium]
MDTQPDPGIQIAGYRIEARVGRGGMGEVYRAVQLSLGRRVALKVLAPELAADDRFRRRFLRESRIAASIDHPSIIPIYESGEDGGLLYIVMRYVDGSDLATLLEREGRLEPARAMAILTQVASALDAAHASGLVHRDVKPANILLANAGPGGDGHCYLCDFGLIKQVDTEQAFSALTATDQFVGTIPYVAPEQIEGREVDGRTDVYSLGCVLFHCLTGSVPYRGENDVEVVFAHLREPPPPISGRVPGLPVAMDAIIARAMAKAKEDRYPSCSALLAAVDAQVAAGAGRAAPLVDDDTRAMVLPPAGSAARGAEAPSAAAPAPTDPAAATRIDPAAARTDPAAARADAAAAAPAPPLARPAGRPVSARSASRPPVGERSGPGGGGPAAVHRGRGAAAVHRGGGPAAVHKGGRGSRRWLMIIAVVVIPVVAYVAAVQLLAGGRQPEVDTTDIVGGPPSTSRPPSTSGSACPGGWTRPAVGTAARSAPLAAIRAHMGWTDRFVVEEIRTFTGPDKLERWYVKAYQESDPSRRGRWLVRQDEDGQRLVVATAQFDTRGYVARDWRVPQGQGALPTGVAGCLAGT